MVEKALYSILRRLSVSRKTWETRASSLDKAQLDWSWWKETEFDMKGKTRRRCDRTRFIRGDSGHSTV